MEEYQGPVRLGNWAESLGSIVGKTEQNLYGNGAKPRGQMNDSPSPSNIWLRDDVYPLSLDNYFTKVPRAGQLTQVEARERDILEEQFKRDVVKNIDVIDK